jgi:hypothetical protein
VSKLEVISPTNVAEVSKIGNDWKVKLADGQMVSATTSSVKNALQALNSIVPTRMTTKKPEKWGEYQVDTTGTRVKVYEGDKVTLDIILGRFGVEGQRSYYTFVRLSEDDEVYVANNFMSFSVPSDASNYRNKALAKINKDSLVAVNFNYPADSSFRLEKVADQWNVNGVQADSAAVAKYLSALNFLNGQTFDDNTSGLIAPAITTTFEMSNGQNITIEGYRKEDQWLVHSSENEEAYFSDKATADKIFIRSNSLL